MKFIELVTALVLEGVSVTLKKSSDDQVVADLNFESKSSAVLHENPDGTLFVEGTL